MKIQFNPDLTYQKDAVEAVVGIFEGQETYRTSFTVTPAIFKSRSAIKTASS
jgi:type III restriction enzyme